MSRIVLRTSLALLFCLGASTAITPASAAGNHCTDRCADRYRARKDVCNAIPYKRGRKSCENAAKRAKEECKHRCR
jgi:hypothetical protein